MGTLDTARSPDDLDLASTAWTASLPVLKSSSEDPGRVGEENPLASPGLSLDETGVLDKPGLRDLRD